MLHLEEIIDLSEFLKREGLKSSPYQIFAAQHVLLSEATQHGGAGALLSLSTLLGPIFCCTPEDQQKFEGLYLAWLRQRSQRPNTFSLTGPKPKDKLKPPTIHWRMKVFGVALCILPLLTAWFLWQDLRLRHVVGQVKTEEPVDLQATARLGEHDEIPIQADGSFSLPFQAKDMPMALTIEQADFLTSVTPIGQEIKTKRNWFYLHPLDWSDHLNAGEILLSKEKPTNESSPLPDPELAPALPTRLTLEKVSTLPLPTPPRWARIDYGILGQVLGPTLLVLAWFLYRVARRQGLQRQSSQIPPALKQVEVQAGTQQLFPSLSLRHLTQRLRQTRVVESAELDVPRTIQCTMEKGGFFTPIYGSRREPGYVALIDRSTMADHQAQVAGQLVKDLAKGYVLVRQYEFVEQPVMLRRVDLSRPTGKPGGGGTALATAVEVVSLEDLQAKFPSRRLLCFVDPVTCFDPLTGQLRPWVDTLEAWDERFLFIPTPERRWGQAERVLSRRGFHVIPLSLLGLRLFTEMLDQGSGAGGQTQRGATSFYDRMPE
ncbi:MAG: hypothetical protein OEY57_09655, partial [Nitrospirota bacterium]|nr:hypothetical protein [Nitrospirota bacterium]